MDNKILYLSEILAIDGWMLIGKNLYCPLDKLEAISDHNYFDFDLEIKKIWLVSIPEFSSDLVDVVNTVAETETSKPHVNLSFILEACLDQLGLAQEAYKDKSFMQELLDNVFYAIRNKIFRELIGVGN